MKSSFLISMCYTQLTVTTNILRSLVPRSFIMYLTHTLPWVFNVCRHTEILKCMLHMPENISSKEVRPKPPVVTASYLHSFLKDQGTNPWLPFLLFAYREVPLPLTEFSPYKLLYGWDVHGPLDLHSKGWESPSFTWSDKVLCTRNEAPSGKTLQGSWGNMSKAYITQKTWYGQQARHCDFQHCQKVLLFLLSANTSGKMPMAVH